MSVPLNNSNSKCVGGKSIAKCEAATEAVKGGLEWFRNPDPDAVQLCLSSEVFVSPRSAEAICEPCGRICVARMVIVRPETTQQLMSCDLTPTEKIEFHFPAIPNA
jgi:hypothetical protein